MKKIKSISILYLEDDELDVDIIRMTIAEGNFKFNLTHVKSKYEFKTALRTMNYDVVIADHNLPDIDSFGVLSIVNDINSNIPIIILAGSLDEEEAIKTLKYGASDYIDKEKLYKLLPSIVKVIDDANRSKKEKLNQEEIKRSEERLTTIFHELLDVIIVFDLESCDILNVNKAVTKNLGYARGNLIGTNFFSLFYDEVKNADKKNFLKKLVSYGYILENRNFKDRRGKLCEMEITITIIPWENEKVGLTTLRNISELK
ncbi:MAG: PAS domain S-box protein [Candidatus Delongbacteria bacterium]|jgi:PAS domain S-box-containing protein|nr:PAS domain S-box protein [Candidatus Delongbacteria bacterium]